MDSLFPVYYFFSSRLSGHHLDFCAMLATKGALDTIGRQMLGSEESKRSRRGAWMCVPDLVPFFFFYLADIIYRLVRICGFRTRCFWHHHDMETTDEQKKKGRS